MAADEAVRNYLLALRDPAALKDTETATRLAAELDETTDPVQRLRLRQQVLNAENIDPQRYEDAFVEHAKAWAESKGVTHAAFRAEGVDDKVLRRAGFPVSAGTRRGGATSAPRKRVNAETVRNSIPKGSFTISDVQNASGASAAVVRRVVQEEVAAGNVTEKGSDPQHRGPGRSPRLYHRS